ncbi:MAG: hypothetical protein KC501_28835 [Myxococcales bacterium]|nr:hypothetical protein [Myxococcales bacterium]
MTTSHRPDPPATPDEQLAFETALGRPLASFPAGRYVLHVYDPDGDGLEGLPEPELAPVDLRALAVSAGFEEEEIEEMDEDELREAIEDELGAARLGAEGDGFPRVAESASLLGLLRIMVEQDLIDLDLLGELEDVRDETLDGMTDLESLRYARFRAIEDLEWRRIALALHGEIAMMRLVYDYPDLVYCQGVLDRRPGWEFVCGWDAIPHRQEEGAAILCKRP